MAYKFFNPNPKGRFVGDCTIRAICKFLDMDWDTVYTRTVFEGFLLKDMPAGNATWGAYLFRRGCRREFIPDSLLGRYSVLDFCRDHPQGRYLLVLDQQVVTVVDGDYYDTWDSGYEQPTYYWMKGE